MSKATSFVLTKKAQVSNSDAGYDYKKGDVIDAEAFEKLAERHKAWFENNEKAEAPAKAVKAGKGKAAASETTPATEETTQE